MPELLTTAQLVLFLVIMGAAIVFNFVGFCAASAGNSPLSQKCAKATMLLLALAVALVLLSIAQNNNFDPWSIIKWIGDHFPSEPLVL